MSLRRIAGAVAAAAVASGAGLLLVSGPSAAAPPPPTPVTLDATGMSSASCPLPLNGSIALVPGTAVQFKPGVLSALSSEKLTIKPAPNSTDPNSSTTVGVPATGTTPITFTRATSYALTWQIKTLNVLGIVVGLNDYKGKLAISGTVSNCQLAVQVPVPSVSAPVVPSPIISAVNGAVSSAVSGVNGVLSPVNSALPPIPTVPAVPGLPGLPGTGGTPGASPSPGTQVPGTNYHPHGPTVADRTVPDGYGSGSGQGGVYVPVTGGSGTGGSVVGQPATGNNAGSRPASPAVKSGGSPRTVELATSRPRSALGALPTLTVILAVLALSGATASYARAFLLQPVGAAAKGAAKPRG